MHQGPPKTLTGANGGSPHPGLSRRPDSPVHGDERGSGRLQPQRGNSAQALQAAAPRGRLQKVSRDVTESQAIESFCSDQIRAHGGIGRATPRGSVRDAGSSPGRLRHIDHRTIPFSLSAALSRSGIHHPRDFLRILPSRQGRGFSFRGLFSADAKFLSSRRTFPRQLPEEGSR